MACPSFRLLRLPSQLAFLHGTGFGRRRRTDPLRGGLWRVMEESPACFLWNPVATLHPCPRSECALDGLLCACRPLLLFALGGILPCRGLGRRSLVASGIKAASR